MFGCDVLTFDYLLLLFLFEVFFFVWDVFVLISFQVCAQILLYCVALFCNGFCDFFLAGMAGVSFHGCVALAEVFLKFM